MQEAMVIIQGTGTFTDFNKLLNNGWKVINSCPTKDERGEEAIFVVIEKKAGE